MPPDPSRSAIMYGPTCWPLTSASVAALKARSATRAAIGDSRKSAADDSLTQQRLDFVLQRLITAASVTQKCCAIDIRPRQSGFEELLNASPSLCLVSHRGNGTPSVPSGATSSRGASRRSSASTSGMSASSAAASPAPRPATGR